MCYCYETSPILGHFSSSGQKPHVGESWVATCPDKIGVKVIAMIQEQIKLAMPKPQWNLSAAIERWPDYTVKPVYSGHPSRNPTSCMAEIVITQWNQLV